MIENKIRENKKLDKKAQMKIQEMAFVLVAVIFLGALLLLFFARFQTGQMEKISTELRTLRTVTMLRVIASMPELSCRQEALCIDADKLNAFNRSASLQSRYSAFWRGSNIARITIEEVYPKSTAVKNYTVYRKTTQENTVTYSTFIPLCSESKQESSCKIAKIKVTTIIS